MRARLQDDDDGDKSEGFWREFFLLPPNRAALRDILGGLRPSEVVLLEGQTRELFGRAVKTVKGGKGVAASHALDVSKQMGFTDSADKPRL